MKWTKEAKVLIRKIKRYGFIEGIRMYFESLKELKMLGYW